MYLTLKVCVQALFDKKSSNEFSSTENWENIDMLLSGASMLTDCKRHDCPFHTRDGVGIIESPNYPRQFPVSIRYT